MFDFVDGQFYENCTNFQPCDASKFLTCTNDRCLCMSTYYHNENVCHPSMCTGLVILLSF